MQSYIDRLDRDQIQDAVRRAEERTAGEIVPVVVPQSDTYEVASWRGGAGAALLTLLGVLLILQFYEGWGLGWLYTSWGIIVVTLTGGVIGAALATYIPYVQRVLAGADLLDETVHRRALQSFLEEEVFDTRDRTGILLFVSLLEHRIEVLGDTGINEQVRPDDWAEIVERIREGLRKDELTDGLVEGIEMCGRLLERKGVGVRPDDPNQLTDSVRTPDQASEGDARASDNSESQA